MSNVLIGVIGVAIFIGLAMAGALFLGPSFTGAQAERQASLHMLQLKQITEAATLRVANGGPMPGDTEGDIRGLQDEGYLRAGLEGYDFSDLEGSSYATVAYRQIADTPANRAVCRAVQRAVGQTVDGRFDPTSRMLRETKTQQGCIVWRFRPNSLAMFVKI